MLVWAEFEGKMGELDRQNESFIERVAWTERRFTNFKRSL